MYKTYGVALGAGIASAMLFMLCAKGTLLAAFLAYFTALPVIIAALCYGHLSGLVAACIGAATIALPPVLGPGAAGVYALVFALPAWWLSRLAMLGKSEAGAGPNGIHWYPVGRLVLWAVALSSGVVLLLGTIFVVYSGGYTEANNAAVKSLVDAAMSADEPADVVDRIKDVAALMVRLAPMAAAGWACFMLLANLWLGGRISQLSLRLGRPWPNVPDGLRLPRVMAAALALCLGLSLVRVGDGALGAAAATIASSLGFVFALQGLGTAHVLTRGFAGRPAILTVIYAITVTLMPPAMMGLTLLGIVDCLGSLRQRKTPSNPPSNTNGVSPWK